MRFITPFFTPLFVLLFQSSSYFGTVECVGRYRVAIRKAVDNRVFSLLPFIEALKSGSINEEQCRLIAERKRQYDLSFLDINKKKAFQKTIERIDQLIKDACPE